jgi:signal transduction histidine kinase
VSAGAATFLSLGLAAACWVIGLAAALEMRRRLARVARAEHELRGPATALLLVCERMRRGAGAATQVRMIEAQLDRLRAGIADLEDARRGRRRSPSPELIELRTSTHAVLGAWRSALKDTSFDWKGDAAVMRLDRGRLGQALGNLVANAAEHGDGEVEVRGRTGEDGVRLEVRNRDPQRGATKPAGGGRGLKIARQAAGDLGGRLHFGIEEGVAVAALELPRPPEGRRDAGTDPAAASGELEAA